MGQVARSMNPPHGNMYDNTLPSSDTSTISSSGENSSTHSPDSTSNTMLMDKYAHITSSGNLMDSLPRYEGDKQLLMESSDKHDDVCLQGVSGSDRDSGNMSKELWNEYRPGLLHYPSLQSKMLSPLPGIFHSLQLRNTDAQPLTTTTADRIAALRSQYDVSFDSDKNDDTVRAIHVAIDELAAMMNAHSLLSDHTNNYAEEQLVKHPDEGSMTATTSTSSLLDSSIPKSPTTTISASISPNNTIPPSTEHISPPPPPQTLHTPPTDQLSRRTTATSTLPAGFQFSFANSSQESTTSCDDHHTRTNESSQQTNIHKRKILPLPKPRVQRTHQQQKQQQQQQQSTPISSEFTFKPPYTPSTHTTNHLHSYGMNHHQTKDDNETSQDYTKKAKRSGDCYTDDDDEDGGMVYRTCNRYNKVMGSSTATKTTTTAHSLITSETDRNRPLDPPHSLLPPSFLQNSFLQPITTENNVSSKPPLPSPNSIVSKSKPISPPPPPQSKKNATKNRSTTSTSSSHTDSHRRTNTNTNNKPDTNRNTRRKQHSKQFVSPSTSASTSKTIPTSRRKGKHGQIVDDIQYQYPSGGSSGGGRKNNDNRLDLVTSTLGPDDWICLFCQYEIFKKGWFTAKRKQLVQEQQKQRLIQKRLEHKSAAAAAAAAATAAAATSTSHSLDQQQQLKDKDGLDG